MKILFLADVPLEDPTSGSEQVLYQQAIGLARKGMEIFAITRQASPPSWIIRDVDGIQEGSYRASVQDLVRSFVSLVKYPSRFYSRFLENIPFKAAICHQPFNCFSLFIKGRLRNVPILYVFHSPSHEEYLLSHENRSGTRNLPQAQLRKMIERFCLKRAVKIVTLSHFMKKKVQDIHGISEDSIVVNPGGVDLDRFKPAQNRERLKKDLGFPEGKIHLLTVRNLDPRMGLQNLVKCIQILKENQVGIHLILGGEGPERKGLEELVEHYSLSDEITMTGFIPSDMLPRYYAAADFFILPTLHLEGFGLVTPESMACGTPVLGTPVGGTKEILSDFGPEFLFKDTSPEAMAEGIEVAIGKYFANNEQYYNLRLRCCKYVVKNYSWQRHIEQLRLVLNEVVGCSSKIQ